MPGRMVRSQEPKELPDRPGMGNGEDEAVPGR